MTTEDYNFYKFLLDAIITIVSLLVGGGIGIVIENKWKISQRFTNRIKQAGDANQAAQISGSPGASSQVAGRDININNFIGGEPRVASADDALGPQAINPLSTDQDFICVEIQRLFQNRGEIFNPRDDYDRAIGFLTTNQRRNAATLFMRIYGRINLHFQSAQFFRDAQRDLNTFENALQQIENLNNDNNATDDINLALSNIEQATRNLLAISRI